MAMNKVIGIIAIFFAALGRAAAAGAQAKPLSGGDVERIYTRLREQIARIPIYDNHSHATFPDDADMDAMAAPPGESSVLRLRDDNPDQAAKNGDMAVYVPLQEKVLKRYMKQEGLGGLPLDLAGYENFVRQTLADNQKKGGVAMKFEAAYFRSLYFGDPPRASAEAIYAKFHAGGLPSEQEYRTFQDYVFRVMIDQAGKLDLPVHFHSAVGIGDYFSLTNGTPLNLENVLRDPRYKNVKFVLIHGGYPHTLEMIWMTAAKNVYTDSSLMGYYVYPSELKNILKQWISLFPEKIMFGSDAFPFNDAVGAEETFWLAAESARTALAAALAELVAEGAFGEAKALELARMYLHDNAAKLYGDQK